MYTMTDKINHASAQDMTDAELERYKAIVYLENEDHKRDIQRAIVFMISIAFVSYPILTVAVSLMDIPDALDILKDIAAEFFLSGTGIIGAYFAGDAYKSNVSKKA